MMKISSQMIWMSLASVLLLSSCSSSKTITNDSNTFWVGGFKTEADAGAGKMQVLNIHKGNDLNQAEWENFYAPIHGFEFEEGYLQKIEVKETPIEKPNIPADASSIRFELVKVINKQKDTRMDINGDWTLATLNDGPINRMVKLPTLQIDLSKMQVSAHGGCNNISGKIKSITTTSIELSPMISTLMACIEPNIEDEFSLALNSIKSYEVKNSILTFMDEDGNKRLSFIKAQAKTTVPQQLHDIWAITKIYGTPIDKKNPVPDMEINLTTMKIMGSNGCNRYNGSIVNISDSEIKFSPIATTRKMCPNMETSYQFDATIPKIVSYKRDGMQLMFFDQDGNEVLTLKKVD